MPSLYRELPGRAHSVRSPWHVNEQPGHWYGASTKFALEHLVGEGKCLVIGSPIFEALELKKNWDITYLDVRQPPTDVNWVEGDATKMPFKDRSFDAVSTACVMTHAGLGRYGDAVVSDGDELMLREIKRVMRPGTLAAVTFGAVVDAEQPILMGNVHRIYTVDEAKRLAAVVGLQVELIRIWGKVRQQWVDKPTEDHQDPDYLSVLLRNVATTE